VRALILVRKEWIEIRIAFPKGCFIPVRDSRISVIVGLVDGIATPRKPVTIGNINWLRYATTRCPVTAVMRFITPVAMGIPMPDFSGEFGSQPISQRSQAGRQHFVNAFVRQHTGTFAALVAVDCAAETLIWDAAVDAAIHDHCS